MSFTERLRYSREGNVFLIRGFDVTGRATWHQLEVLEENIAAFEQALAKGLPVNLETFGTVLDSGYGERPQA